MAYIALADAKTRIAAICLSSELTAWTAATDGDKQILLDRAAEKLESLAFVGERYQTIEEGQEELFPRVDARGGIYDYDYDEDDYVIPQAVKDAICLEAVTILARQSDSLHEDLQARGVTSVKISDVSYTYGSDGSSARGGFFSDRAWRLLERYLARDVDVI